MQRAVLHEHRCDGAAALIQAAFDHDALCPAVRVGAQLFHIGDEQHHFEQLGNALFRQRGNGHADGISAPLLGHQVILCEILLDHIGVGRGLIHFVDGDDDRHAGSLGMVDGFHGLRHDTVVGGNDQNGDIGRLRAAGTHCREGFMPRGI